MQDRTNERTREAAYARLVVAILTNLQGEARLDKITRLTDRLVAS
jgi:hypothetical protein